MEFKDIAAVTGRPGLFQILKPTRSGVILESIDAQKLRMIINSNSKVSILKDISIYVTTSENNVLLQKVMQNVHKVFAGKLDVSSKSTDAELRAFMKKVIPEYDADRVYVSDIKKLATWYMTLASNCAEVFEESEAAEDKKEALSETDKDSKPTEETPKAEKPKAAKAKATEPKSEVKEEKPKATAKPKAAKS